MFQPQAASRFIESMVGLFQRMGRKHWLLGCTGRSAGTIEKDDCGVLVEALFDRWIISRQDGGCPTCCRTNQDAGLLVEGTRTQSIRFQERLGSGIVMLTEQHSISFGAIHRVLMEVKILLTSFLDIAGVARVLWTLLTIDI